MVYNSYVAPIVTHFRAWYNGPSQENSTIQEIESILRRQAEESAGERDRRLAQDKRAMERQQREVDERKRKDMAIAKRIKEKTLELELLVEHHNDKEEEDIRTYQATGRAQTIRQMEDTTRAQTEVQRIKEVGIRGVETRKIEVQQQTKIEEQNRLAREVAELKHRRLERKRQNCQQILSVILPHLQEYKIAKEKIQYDPNCFRFAVAGCSC